MELLLMPLLLLLLVLPHFCFCSCFRCTAVSADRFAVIQFLQPILLQKTMLLQIYKALLLLPLGLPKSMLLQLCSCLKLEIDHRKMYRLSGLSVLLFAPSVRDATETVPEDPLRLRVKVVNSSSSSSSS